MKLEFCSYPKSFWKFIWNTTGGVPNTVSLDNISVTGSIDVANLFWILCLWFYYYYHCIYTSYTSFCLSYDLPSNFSFSVNEFEHGISKLHGFFPVDPDGLSGVFLFNLKVFLTYLLWLFFRWFLDKSTYPDLNSITPILKKGNTFFVNNYRPFPLLCLILLNCLSLLFYIGHLLPVTLF